MKCAPPYPLLLRHGLRNTSRTPGTSPTRRCSRTCAVAGSLSPTIMEQSPTATMSGTPITRRYGSTASLLPCRTTNHTKSHTKIQTLQSSAVDPRRGPLASITEKTLMITKTAACQAQSTGTSLGWVAMQDCTSQHIGSRLTAGRSGLLNLACPAVPFTKSRTSGRAALPEREQPKQHNRQHGNIMHATLSPLC